MTSNGTTTTDPASHLLDQIVEFPGGFSFERLLPLTDLRRDVDEARILYTCRRVAGPGNEAASGESVMKVKIQCPKPDGTGEPLPGPSATTSAELEALKKFKQAGHTFLPHYIRSKRQVQGHDGLLPGGYITITVMTKMPGTTVWDMKFWSLPESERDEVRELFLQQLKAVWALGIAPYDCALRNILWDRETWQCSIIDFEHWTPVDPINAPTSDEEITKELQKWGVVQRPPSSNWAQEWGLIN